jgi:hypothetical protein
VAIKTLIIGTKVDRAKRAHNCQANAKHRIEAGDVRLGVRNERSWDHYCLDCAEKIIVRDINKLTELRKLEPQQEE